MKFLLTVLCPKPIRIRIRIRILRSVRLRGHELIESAQNQSLAQSPGADLY